MIKISSEWDEILKEQFESPTYKKLHDFLKEEYFNIIPPYGVVLTRIKQDIV